MGEVALKVAKAEFTAHFEREARTLAAFEHKNICRLYDVGTNYLAMELLDGVLLVSQEKPGPLPVQKAVEYAGQILDALDAAHRKGFTHRDLKPANVMVTKEAGNKTCIKLLDFGLAKRTDPPKHDDVTMTALTMPGQIAGTPQYMAPERLQCKEADARSDIFSFGCVL
jgi:serine/threonine protein kinase